MQAGEAARPRTESQDVQSHDGTMPSGGKRAAGGEGEGRGNRGHSMQGEAGLRTQSKAGKRGVGHLHRQSPSRFGADMITGHMRSKSARGWAPRDSLVQPRPPSSLTDRPAHTMWATLSDFKPSDAAVNAMEAKSPETRDGQPTPFKDSTRKTARRFTPSRPYVWKFPGERVRTDPLEAGTGPATRTRLLPEVPLGGWQPPWGPCERGGLGRGRDGSTFPDLAGLGHRGHLGRAETAPPGQGSTSQGLRSLLPIDITARVEAGCQRTRTHPRPRTRARRPPPASPPPPPRVSPTQNQAAGVTAFDESSLFT